MKLRLQYLLTVLTAWMASLPLEAAIKNWKGGTLVLGDPEAAFRWSEPGNWDPSGVPQNGDRLIFFVRAAPGQGAAVLTINDLPGLTVASMSFGANADFQTTEFSLLGNQTLGIAEYIEVTASTEADVHIRCGLRLDGQARFEAGVGATLDPYLGLHFDGPIDLNGHNLRLVEQSGDLDVAGAISGAGDLTILEGSVELTGDVGNTFNGTTTVAGGFGSDLILNKSSGLAVPGGLVISTNSAVKLDRPHQIADTATVFIESAGQFKLQGNTETISRLLFGGHSVAGYYQDTLVDTGGATLSVMDNISADNSSTNPVPVIKGLLGLPPGNHLIHTSGSQDWALHIEAKIIGDGGFTKTGDKGLLLSGDNSFNGDAVLQEGTVDVSHANALGSASGWTFLDGAELDVRDAAIGNETLLVNRGLLNGVNGGLPGARLLGLGTSSWAGDVMLNTNLTVGAGQMTFSGPIRGSGGMAFYGFLSGPGTMTGAVRYDGTAANTYTGPTLAQGPLLEFNKPSGVAAFGGALIVGVGSSSLKEVRWLQNYQKVGADVTILSDGLVNLNNHSDDFGPIAFTGGTISTGNGELGVYGLVTVNPSSAQAIITGRLGLPSGFHEFRVGDGAPLADLAVDAVVVGPGHLRKTGLGQMWLNSSNSYAGLTMVAEGSLVAFNADALGASSTGTTVNDGASLILNANGSTVREPIAIQGPGDGSHGALNVFGNVTLRNPFPSIFACLDLTTNATIRVEPGGTLTADGFISGIGPLTKTGPGTLVFANPNTNSYSGDTVIRDGSLELRKPNFAVAVPGDLVIGPAPFNSSASVRFFQSGGLTAGRVATVNAGSLLDLNGNGQLLSRLNLNDGGDAQTGPGLLSFPVGGLVAVGSLGQLGSHASSYLSGNLGLPANATLTFAVGAYAPTAPFDFKPELEMFAQVPAPAENPNFERAGLAKSGPGTMLLTAGNSFNGRVDVLGGTLIAAHNTALGSAFDGTFVLNNATLALQGNLAVSDEILVLGSTAAPALDNRAGANLWNGPIILNQSGTVGVANETSLDVAGSISGTRNLTKIGAGTLTLSGLDPNSYDGETFINEGTLLMNKPFTVTAIPGPLSIGTPAGAPAMAANLAGYQIVGNIFVNRGGLLNLNGQEENVDHLWLSDGGDVETTTGTLYIKTGGSIQVLPGTVSDVSTINGNLDFNPGAHVLNIGAGVRGPGEPDLLIPALITGVLGAVDLQKNGAGTLRLTANNTYSGSTVVAAGILQVDGSQLGSSMTVQGGAQLMGIGRVGAVNYALTGGVPGVVAPGHSPGVLSCGNFNLGAAGGTLRIELNGTTPGANGYDQLWVRGALSFAELSGVTLDASLNFASTVNDQFIILRKDGVRLVTGEFNGLPEGANFYIGGEQFTITYAGGDGNDVVLTRLPTPPKPALRIEQARPGFVRVLWPSDSISDGYSLQSTTNLNPPNWTAALPLPVIVGTNNVVTNAAAGERKFYRLFRP
jgi:autotransporter-associated beta strand protein